jgi:hypothetical protein
MWQIAKQIFHFFLCKSIVFSIPFFSFRQSFSIHRVTFGFVAELVVEKFVKEHFRYNFILAPRTSQSKGTGGTFQGINKGYGGL